MSKNFVLKRLALVGFIAYNFGLQAQSWPPAGMLGDGTSGNPWQITDSSHLRALADFVNANYQNGYATRNVHYKLMNDIDLMGYSNWSPIGIYPSEFEGIFDGNGKVVQNITINRPVEDHNGLFARIRYATIENLGVINCNIIGHYYVGGLIGYGNQSVISNCYATGSVNGNRYIGGLVGYNLYHSTISNCYATCNVSGDDERVGGLIGSIANSTMDSCYATGNVSGNNYSVGGLAGHAENDTISNSYATGNVNGVNSNVGGLVGFAYTVNGGTSISNCYATGNVSGNNESVGGLIGYNYCTRMAGGEGGNIYYSSVIYCYAAGNVSGDSNYVGGLIGYNNNSAVRNCVAANDTVIASTNTTYISRIVGYNNNGGGCQNNYALDSMTVRNSLGNVFIFGGLNTEPGVGILIDSLRSFSFYNTYSNWYSYVPWDINSDTAIWKICDGKDLPFLRYQGISCIFITATAIGNGSISPSGTISVKEDTNQTFTFSADNCYEIDSLWIDSVYFPDSIAAGSYIFNNIAKNHTIEVSFKRLSPDTVTISDTICYGINYTQNNFNITNAIIDSVYFNNDFNSNGCDSVTRLDLTVNPLIITQISENICEGDFYDFHGDSLTASGIYYDTLPAISGCDSIIELTLTVVSIDTTKILVDICEGDSYDFFGRQLTEEGIYYETLQTIHGCDSVIELTLTVEGVGIVETRHAASLRIYPNPTDGKLHITYAETLRATSVQMFDVVGKQYSVGAKHVLPNEEIVIDISHLAAGMYFLKIGGKVFKVVKE
ncbi:MAG: T9SS type A sorting domain-containing protein [Lentimicrobiaceae bacterium]|nr:T9SS type A sorting domain-containing protein [Lentimicrobiaceae bacterium]